MKKWNIPEIEVTLLNKTEASLIPGQAPDNTQYEIVKENGEKGHMYGNLS